MKEKNIIIYSNEGKDGLYYYAEFENSKDAKEFIEDVINDGNTNLSDIHWIIGKENIFDIEIKVDTNK